MTGWDRRRLAGSSLRGGQRDPEGMADVSLGSLFLGLSLREARALPGLPARALSDDPRSDEAVDPKPILKALASSTVATRSRHGANGR